MRVDSWEPWLTELEQAADARDEGRLRAGLADLERFSFHEQRGKQPKQWDRFFALLLRLAGLG